MSEPECFIRGKQFQKIFREDFRNDNKDGLIEFEKTRRLSKKKTGRLDVLLTELGDYVAIYEIKATNLDSIKPQNNKKNDWWHQF